MANNSTISTCKLWPNNPFKCNILFVVQHIFPSISILGCSWILLIIWLFKKYHVFVQRLIVALVTSALFLSVSYLLGNVHMKHSQLRCYAQSIFMQYFLWATLSWVIVISVNMIFIVKGIDSKKYELFYHAFAWTNALLWAGIPFVNNSYGPAGVWCWIKKEASILRFGVWYLPLLIVCLCLSVMYVYMFIRNRRLAKYSSAAELEQTFQIYQREVKPLLVYPFIYILLTIPIFVYRLYDVTHPHHEPKFVLLLTAVVFAPSAGFAMQ
ncbi:cyclic AMP receptor 3-like isoform X3 [Hydractinia symbiolongicarpus]|uniref:cyclic AMP receptor 3-like isoform X3 n=1 Tax=Hydractinia symbiolongicarpus TaxID=13093 RepID=UPI00254CDAF0|nr:cyclic AMP receptor 3-like isoform X3 [Hydractinia symbiolongicarpus]